MASLESALDEERREILALLDRPSPSDAKSAKTASVNPRSPSGAPRTSSPFRGRPKHGTSMGALDYLREDSSPSPPPPEPRSQISRDSSPAYQNLTQSISSSLRNRRASSGQASSNRSGSFSASSPPNSSIAVPQAYQDQLAAIYGQSGPLSSGQSRNARPTSSSILRAASPIMQHRASSPIPGQQPFSSPLSSPPLNAGKTSLFAQRSKSQGSESIEPKKGLTGHARTSSIGSNTTDGGYRLDKDSTYTGEDGKEVAVESSDESSDDSDGGESSRGRKSQSSNVDSKPKEDQSFDPTARIMSLLAAADDEEEERKFSALQCRNLSLRLWISQKFKLAILS